MQTQTSLKNKRRTPDVRKIKKRSNRNTTGGDSGILVSGPRKKTNTGAVVPGYGGDGFETYYEVMVEGTSTDTFCNPDKERVIRVVSGTLWLVTTSSPEAEKAVSLEQKRLMPGDEAVLAKGSAYRMATSNEPAELFVCQDAGYMDSVVVVRKTEVHKDTPQSLLQEPVIDRTREEIDPSAVPTRRKGSKAKQQLAALRSSTSAQVQENVTQKLDDTIDHPSRVAGVNAKPTGGAFSEEGAG